MLQNLNRSVLSVGLLLLLAQLPVFAQTTDAVPPSNVAASSGVSASPEPSTPSIIELAPARASTRSGSTRSISTEANASGTYGELVLETAGSVLLRSIGAIPITFETDGVERARILGNGNMSIGATNNTARLHVVNTANNSRSLYAAQATTIGANTDQTDIGIYVDEDQLRANQQSDWNVRGNVVESA